jgi:hypothetical protein
LPCAERKTRSDCAHYTPETATSLQESIQQLHPHSAEHFADPSAGHIVRDGAAWKLKV